MSHRLAKSGAYIYVMEGGPMEVNGIHIPELGAAKIEEETELTVEAKKDAEILLHVFHSGIFILSHSI